MAVNVNFLFSQAIPELDRQGARWNSILVTLTLELSDLRTANDEVLAQLGRSRENEFDMQIADIESFLMSIYRIAVLAVRSEHQIERAAEVWRVTLDVIDSAAKKIQTVTAGRCDHPAIDRILEIRSAASDMLELYADPGRGTGPANVILRSFRKSS